MSRPWALLPGEYASGVRVVETTLRPARPVCLIPDDDQDLAAGFARSRCLAWAGHASYAIPYSRSDGLSERWEELLGLLDPDQVFALGPLRDAEKGRLNDAGWFVYPRDQPTSLFGESSALLHPVLDGFGEDLEPPESPSFVVVPRAGDGPRDFLPVVARFGGLDHEEVERTLEKRPPTNYRYDLDLSRLIRVKEVDPLYAPLDVFAGDLRGLVGEEGVQHALTLPDLTTRGLRITGFTRSHEDRGVREVEAEYRAPVVVTGALDSVEDFALYWNLRAEHFFAKPFPLWLPLAWLEEEDGPGVVEGALARANEGLVVPRTRDGDVRIVSASTGADELEERLRGSFPNARIGSEGFADLFKTGCYYRSAIEKSTAHFERGRASIRPPRPEAFKGFSPYKDRVAYDVGVDGMWLPQGKAVARRLGRFPDHARELVSARGKLRFVEPFTRASSETGLLDIRTPDGWGLLCSVFEERGYDIAPTPKAAAALGQIALLGGVGNLKVVASSKVRDLLRVLSRRRGEKRPFVAQRKTLTFEHFRAKWGREAARDVLRWLVERRVVFRGAVLECPRCRLSGWYPVDRVGEVWRCDGCQEDSPIPLEPDKTDWHYSINELYAHGHNQGTLTPLLTLHAMAGAWSDVPGGEGLGFYPGVELTAKEGARVPFPKKEVDLVALRGRDLVLAECKESTEHLAAPEKAAGFARQLADTVALADHLDASELLVASSTTFPVKEETMLGEVPADHSVELSWLDGRDLLDPHFFAKPLTFPGARGGAGKPEKWDEEYLELLRRGLADAGG